MLVAKNDPSQTLTVDIKDVKTKNHSKLAVSKYQQLGETQYLHLEADHGSFGLRGGSTIFIFVACRFLVGMCYLKGRGREL